MNADKIKEIIKNYIFEQLDIIGQTSPVINFAKPIVKRVVNNNINKYDKFLDLLKDENGEIDMLTILNEEIEILDNIINFSFNIPIFGNCKINNGVITIPIPLTDSGIKLDKNDLSKLKEMIANN